MTKEQNLQAAIKRFWSRVNVRGPRECWYWKRPANSYGGYAHMYFAGRRVMIHRISMELHLGKILPPHNQGKVVVRHTCDHPLCVNPKHLRLGTQTQNVEDMVRKGRTPKGEDRPAAKLTEKAVKDIRKNYKLRPESYPTNRLWPFSLTAFSLKYGVNCGTIRDVVIGKAWTHVK